MMLQTKAKAASIRPRASRIRRFVAIREDLQKQLGWEFLSAQTSDRKR